MNVCIHSPTPSHMRYQKKAMWVANLSHGFSRFSQSDCDFKCSENESWRRKKWWYKKQRFICFATFLWIISSFCICILTKCMKAFINKVLYEFIQAFLVWKSNKLALQHFSRLGAWVATVMIKWRQIQHQLEALNQHIHNSLQGVLYYEWIPDGNSTSPPNVSSAKVIERRSTKIFTQHQICKSFRWERNEHTCTSYIFWAQNGNGH